MLTVLTMTNDKPPSGPEVSAGSMVAHQPPVLSHEHEDPWRLTCSRPASPPVRVVQASGAWLSGRPQKYVDGFGRLPKAENDWVAQPACRLLRREHPSVDSGDLGLPAAQH